MCFPYRDGRDKPGHDKKREQAAMSVRTTPPFRADHVGSLLRPAPLKQARAQREQGEISAEALKAVEDREIEKVIKRQEDIGLKAVTDGEFRRAFWNYDFLGPCPALKPISASARSSSRASIRSR